MDSAYFSLLEYLQSLTVIDTHEHLPAHERLSEQSTDILREYLIHYFSCDLVSAGLPPADLERARDCSLPLVDRWRLVEPYWNAARFTGYGRALDRSVRILYGLPGLNGSTVEEANRAFLASLQEGGRYRRILRDACRLHTSLLDGWTLDCDRDFFTPVHNINEWVRPGERGAMAKLCQQHSIRLHSLADYEEGLKADLLHAKSQGAAALKCSLAYQRTLCFPRPSRADAEEEFAATLRYGSHTAWEDSPRQGGALENHMMHLICGLAGELDLPLQIHTGLQEGNGNLLSASNPLHLNNLFMEYPGTRFDIFHIGYPWHIQLAALAKNFANVYIDMCWSHIISPRSAMEALSEYLDAVPCNKIMAFGGDYCFVDAVPGHLEMAKEHVARVLAEKIALGVMDLDLAKDIAERLFFRNPAQLFRIKVS